MRPSTHVIRGVRLLASATVVSEKCARAENVTVMENMFSTMIKISGHLLRFFKSVHMCFLNFTLLIKISTSRAANDCSVMNWKLPKPAIRVKMIFALVCCKQVET